MRTFWLSGLCKGFACWACDINNSLLQLAGESLPLPDVWLQDGQTLDRLRKKIYLQMLDDMESRIAENHRLFLLHGRRELQKEGSPKRVHLGLRHYLTQVGYF